jgi:hypothetical protein
MARVLVLALVIFGLQAAASHAQSPNAAVGGQITDAQGRVVPDVTVVLTNLNTGIPYEAKTNGNGFYSAPNLPPGIYRANVTKDGFKNLVKGDIELHVQDIASINFQLQIGSVAETVTVEGGALVVNTTDAAVSTVVDRQFVANVPLNGRSFQSLIGMIPGIVTVPISANQTGTNGPGASGEFSVNGQRSEGNYFTVDGVAANTGSSPNTQTPFGLSGATPAETAIGTTQSLASIDDLQEFRAQTSTFSAEYGRTPGGQFSIVTRSGTNTWHGSAFEYFRNDVFDANNWFNNSFSLPKPPERQNDFGGTLGGPIVIPHLYNGKDRTFFFFSYEGLRLRQPQAAKITLVPDTALRANSPASLQSLLNAFPLPTQTNGKETEVLDFNGQPTGLAQYVATYSNPSSLDATSIRIDHTFTPNFTVFGRYNTVPSDALAHASRDLAEFIATSFNLKSITLGATNIFGTVGVNDFRFNFTQHQSSAPVTINNFGGAISYDLGGLKDAAGQPFPRVNDLNFLLQFPVNDANQSTFFTSNETGDTTFSSQHQINITDSFVKTIRSHTLKFGVDYRRLATPLTPRKLGVTAIFRSVNSVTSGIADLTIPFTDSLIPTEPVYQNTSLYAQDEWKTTRRLSLSLGLRWDFNPPPTDAHGNPPYTLNQITDLATAVVAPVGTPLWKTTHNNFAPRLGAAYQLRQTPGRETVVRGGFGVFYDIGNTYASQGYFAAGFGNFGFNTSVPFPSTQALSGLTAPSVNPPNLFLYAFNPNLKLPYTLQWNIAVQQSLGSNQAITATYVGASGQRLLIQRSYDLSGVNPIFAPLGPGKSVFITNNGASSNYNSLQLQYQRRLSRGLQVLASYTWSHSIDNSSTNLESDALNRGNSDFDIRNNFQAALTYDIPGQYSNLLARALLEKWSVDTRISARSAAPVDLLASSSQTPDKFGTIQNVRVDVVPGVPEYLHDSTAPGGRVINANAFAVPTVGFGNAPRNSLRGFNASQVDLAIHRQFPIYERVSLQFRAEAFNLFNHPNFGVIDNTLGDLTFGRATDTLNNTLGGLSALYQVGGPRSMQLTLRLQF